MAAETSDRFAGRILNSSSFLFTYSKRLMVLVLFILPAIMGLSVYRDFSTRIFPVLYAYPFGKWDYLGGKFLSAFAVLTGIVSMIGLGYYLGFQMPWINPDLVGPDRAMIYIQLYAVFFIPNMLLLSVIVFAVVLLSRNIYAGFIAVFIMIILHVLTTNLLTAGQDSMAAT
ncbi:MAG: hypothetical protein AAFP02_12085, partial [Bacteroidota bacterium]